MADEQADIQVFNETDISLPFTQKQLQDIAPIIAKEEDCMFTFLEIIYVDEQEIVRINKEHLDRDYITDIITFPYNESSEKKDTQGTLFCCAPRILEQAKQFNQTPEREFLRIYIHGLLHLAGYDDQNSSQKKQMRAKENIYLGMIS